MIMTATVAPQGSHTIVIDVMIAEDSEGETLMRAVCQDCTWVASSTSEGRPGEGNGHVRYRATADAMYHAEETNKVRKRIRESFGNAMDEIEETYRRLYPNHERADADV